MISVVETTLKFYCCCYLSSLIAAKTTHCKFGVWVGTHIPCQRKSATCFTAYVTYFTHSQGGVRHHGRARKINQRGFCRRKLRKEREREWSDTSPNTNQSWTGLHSVVLPATGFVSLVCKFLPTGKLIQQQYLWQLRLSTTWGNREQMLHSAALMQVIQSHETHYLSGILNSNSFTFW